MNKDRAKRSFVIRTVAAIVVIYVLIVGSVTYYFARQNMELGAQQSDNLLERLEKSLDSCRSTSSSKGVVNGMNLVKANAVLRQYDSSLGMWDPEGRTDTLLLYQAEKDDQGNVTGLKKAESNMTVLSDPFYSKEDEVVVLDDWFSQQQIEEMKQASQKGDFAEVKGYKTKELFEPVSVRISYTEYLDEEGDKEVTKEKTFKSDKPPTGKKMTTLNLDFFDIDSVDVGSWQQRDETWEILEKNAPEFTANQNDLAESAKHYLGNTKLGLWKLEKAGFVQLGDGDYWLGYSIIDHPALKALKSSLWLDFLMMLVCAAVGMVLIGSYCRTLDAQYEAEKKRRQMSDAMAHEMKTPLGIIKNYSEVLLEEQDSKKREEYLNTIIEETDSMNAMVVSMLDLSKMEAGTYPLELSMISLTGIAQRVIERTTILAQRKNLKVQLDSQEEWRILADEKLVSQSICNLLLNAITHAEEGSNIRISIDKGEKGIRFSIHNRGKQLSDKEQNRIWESFYRGDSARNHKSGGTGLGLAIVRNTSLIHKGICGCQNENDGVAFWLEVPDQENRQKLAGGKIGPIINAENTGLNLKGLIYGIAGTLIWLLCNAYAFILKRYEWPLDVMVIVIPWILSIPGWILCLIGARKLKFLTRKLKLTYAAIPLILTGVALCSMIPGSELTVLFPISLAVGTIGAGLYLCAMAFGCAALADRTKEKGLRRIITFAFGAELVCLACWLAARSYIGFSDRIANMATGLTFLIILANLYLWYHIYRKYHGKEI
ncbi:HAMP domain-containing histidine kinase [Anaerovorax odorimutans]|uniref:histidine kinase n=1 Tax=Anaerovorax odorimutans TaxID=109327 RepID=A0ABT1RJ07_9FIRM|nr:HAMP domain-containing sensor histidine kinase [Anaerovorax odorimutans]MCQ4635161.1 HAMP domain-containing histidine kinase [Anaerovorax odorimutans]